MARFSSHETMQHAGRPNKNYRVPKAAMAEHRIRLRPDRSCKHRSGGEGDGDTIPSATVSVGLLSGRSWSIDSDAGTGRCSLDLL
jgi:hypothetical protein